MNSVRSIYSAGFPYQSAGIVGLRVYRHLLPVEGPLRTADSIINGTPPLSFGGIGERGGVPKTKMRGRSRRSVSLDSGHIYAENLSQPDPLVSTYIHTYIRSPILGSELTNIVYFCIIYTVYSYISYSICIVCMYQVPGTRYALYICTSHVVRTVHTTTVIVTFHYAQINKCIHVPPIR